MIDTPTRPVSAALKPERLKLIFNPAAGDVGESPYQLAEILALLQMWQYLPEVHVVTQESDLEDVVALALRQGIRTFAVAGGDGTIESALGPLVGTRATLCILPTGTRNNVALSLGVPLVLSDAVELLRTGQRSRIDVGYAECEGRSRWFLETSSIGLVPELYPAVDDIQHGNLARIADALNTLVASQPRRLFLHLDEEQVIEASGHLALVANMPYFGANFQVSPDVSWSDDRLDVFLFSEFNKLELVSYAVQIVGGAVPDPRIQHYRARQVVIQASPTAPVMADGFSLGEGTLIARVRPRGLNVFIPDPDRQAGSA